MFNYKVNKFKTNKYKVNNSCNLKFNNKIILHNN